MEIKSHNELKDDWILEGIQKIQNAHLLERTTGPTRNSFLVSNLTKTEWMDLTQKGEMIIVATEKSRVLGYMLFSSVDVFLNEFQNKKNSRFESKIEVDFSKVSFLYQVAVAKETTGKGIGAKMLNFFRDLKPGQTILTDTLRTPMRNIGSENFFIKQGFKEIGILFSSGYRNFGDYSSTVFLSS